MPTTRFEGETGISLNSNNLEGKIGRTIVYGAAGGGIGTLIGVIMGPEFICSVPLVIGAIGGVLGLLKN